MYDVVTRLKLVIPLPTFLPVSFNTSTFISVVARKLHTSSRINPIFRHIHSDNFSSVNLLIFLPFFYCFFCFLVLFYFLHHCIARNVRPGRRYRPVSLCTFFLVSSSPPQKKPALPAWFSLFFLFPLPYNSTAFLPVCPLSKTLTPYYKNWSDFPSFSSHNIEDYA